MPPKRKSTKVEKKVTKESGPQRLFNEGFDYEDEEWKKRSPKAPSPPPTIEVEKSEETGIEEITPSNHTASEQTISE